MSEPTPSAFGWLLDRQVSAAQRERLMKARAELALGDQDALWALLGLVEDYCAALLERRPLPSQSDQPLPTPAPSQVPWRLLALAMAGQVLLMASAMYVGALAASDGGTLAWSRCQQDAGPQSTLTAILNAPAGWLAFVVALPTLAHGVRLGWRVRAAEPAVGWIIIGTSTLTATGLVGLLLWLL